MRVITALVFGLIGALLVVPSVSSQQLQYTVYGQVFEDLNADGSFDNPPELLSAGWLITLYDSGLSLVGQDSSSGSDLTEIIASNEPAYVCLEPQTGWTLTAPTSGPITSPGSDWSCYEYDTNDVERLYEFGVTLTEADPEQTGELVDDSPQPDTEQKEPQPDTTEPAVLGATSDANVLAETGLPAIWAPLFGIGLITAALSITKKAK